MKYPEKESATLEFKRDVPDKKQTMLKTVVGFANTYGGQIIIGIDDSCEIIGTPETLVDQLIDDITRVIYDSITPSIYPSLRTRRMGDKLLLIIDIAEGFNKPYYFSAKRMSEGTYVRLGAHTVLATGDMIHQLQWQTQRKFLDEMPVYSAIEEDLDKNAFETFLNTRKQKNIAVNIHDMLYHYEILVKDRGRVHPSVAGILLFGKQAEKFFPEAFIICTHYMGISGREVVATRDCTGDLFQQYRDAVSFIMSRLNRSFTIKGVGPREEQLEIPEEAIREIMINAIVHRNYQIHGAIKISIYDDRLEIFSPGNFPGPIMPDHVNIGVTYIRNTIITRIFRDIGIIEKLGSGFITLFDSYAKRELPRPIVVEGVGFIKCILPRPTTQVRQVRGISENEFNRIEQMFYARDEIDVQDVMSKLSVSRATASRLLSQFTQQGLLQRVGKGPATRYRKVSG